MQTDLVMKTKPYEHQRHVLETTWDKPYWGLFCEMGVGKSKIVIDTFVNLYLAGHVDTILYVAKKGELANFQIYELPKHVPDHIDFDAQIYSGYTSTKSIKQIQNVLTPRDGLRIFSMNIESIRSEKPYAIAEKFLRTSRKTMIIVDESTTMKDPNSKQTKAMMQLKKYSKYRRIMTGTVIPHGPVDVWSQARFLDPNVMGYKSKTAFKAQYLVQEIRFAGTRRFNAVIGSKNLDDLQNRMRTFATVLTKADCLDLPDKIYSKRSVPLTPMQIKMYNDFLHYAVSQLPDGEWVEAVNALSVMSKLHQIVCGQIKTEDGYLPIDNNRAEMTHDLVADILSSGADSKIVIWSHFREATAQLVDYMKSKNLGLVWMEAGMTIDERQARIETFKNDPECKLFIANPASSGFGITLTESHTAIYYSNSDNYEHRLQSEDRIHRIGQENKCQYFDMHTPGTVEDAIFDRTRNKGGIRESVMGRNEFIQMLTLKASSAP